MQTSFSDLEYAAKTKQTRRDRFLAKIVEVIKTHRAVPGLMMCEGTIVDANLIAAPP